MYYYPYVNPYPYYMNNPNYYSRYAPMHANMDGAPLAYQNFAYAYPAYPNPFYQVDDRSHLKDYGGKPYVVNIEEATEENETFRTAIWTGDHLQVTVMSIPVGGDVGLEVHPNVDQFLRIEEGEGITQMGNTKDNLTFQRNVYDDYAIMVPAGTWHNITNTGDKPLKLYSIYGPPNHPFGTVHRTQEEAMEMEEHYH
ncbi:cupin [Virgibacillus dokdonensis]|uniref:Cupin n=1 Tax=Virgibacillus dokdonensis TaxID=302167 RepID=A0A3E0WMX9_9BACI|nr:MULTISPECIES: cupin domain-containing protein [Virgibacillus]RFA34312.1 cupin [Virgibacillus dokdonensis]